MVTKQEQLEFAAKHIEKWKSGYDYAIVERDADGYLYVRWPSVCTRGISKKEWRQERDKMSSKPEIDNSWYERGELPPVGAYCCGYVTQDDRWIDIEVIAHRDGHALGWSSDEKRGFRSDNAECFRPFRTEREKAIEHMDAALRNRGSAISDVILGELYDAGFRMVNP